MLGPVYRSFYLEGNVCCDEADLLPHLHISSVKQL